MEFEADIGYFFKRAVESFYTENSGMIVFFLSRNIANGVVYYNCTSYKNRKNLVKS